MLSLNHVLKVSKKNENSKHLGKFILLIFRCPLGYIPHTIPFGGFQETPLTKKVLYGKKIDLAIKMGKAAPVPNSAMTFYEKPVLRT